MSLSLLFIPQIKHLAEINPSVTLWITPSHLLLTLNQTHPNRTTGRGIQNVCILQGKQDVTEMVKFR
jgi:hypothetical protein